MTGGIAIDALGRSGRDILRADVDSRRRPSSASKIDAAIRAAAEGPVRGIPRHRTHGNLSSDRNHTLDAGAFRMGQSKVMKGAPCPVLSHHDGERGGCSRMADAAAAVGRPL